MSGRAKLILAIAAALLGGSGAVAQRGTIGQLPALPPVTLPGVPQLPSLPPLPGGPSLPTIPGTPNLPTLPGADPAIAIGDTVDRALPDAASLAVDRLNPGRQIFDTTRWLGAAPVGASAQVAVPTAGGGVTIGPATVAAPGPARVLTPEQRARLNQLLSAGGGRIVLDDIGEAARAGEIVLNDPDPATLAALAARGFRVIEQGTIEGLGIGYARLAIPGGTTLADALRAARAVSPGAASDVLHFASGEAPTPTPTSRGGQVAGSRSPVTVGMIDSGVGAGIAGRLIQRGFAEGAPRASDHGTAVASLIAGGGRVAGAARGATIVAGDVYGSDPAGGNALAIAKALGWLAVSRVPVVTISLVGPANPLLARAVAAAQARGMVIVAPVGNDGPASAPVYPASYPGVIAVTGVDARGRVLIEAGRATHLDYAAPGADLLALGASGQVMRVRGTSFAAPLVAATIARALPTPDPARVRPALAAVDAGARDLGASGPDAVFGRGVVCSDCATRR